MEVACIFYPITADSFDSKQYIYNILSHQVINKGGISVTLREQTEKKD